MSVDCIVAFSFGSGKNGFINHANRSLRTNILASDFVCNAKPPPPFIVQGELAGGFIFFNSQMDPPAHLIMESHPWRIICDARAFMLEHNWRTCVVAAHADHIELRIALLQKLGAKVEGTITTETYDFRAKEFFFRSRLASRIYHSFEKLKYKKWEWT